jgi:hypothetical protein
VVAQGFADPVEASCSTSGVEKLKPVPPTALLESSAATDLVFTNRIDLAAHGGTCIGPKEYALQVTNKSTETSYTMDIDASYICSTSKSQAQHCQDVGSGPFGDGFNSGSFSSVVLSTGASKHVIWYNDDTPPGFTLPRCCDIVQSNPNYAWWVKSVLQCATFTVTHMGSTPISPPYVVETSSYDGDAPNFDCDFIVDNVFSQVQDDLWVPDVDLDTVTGSTVGQCDNCYADWNPTQADADHDGIGNVCDPDYPCLHCVAPAGVCDGEAPGTPCGVNPSCGGTCRFCGGNWGCFQP